MHSLIWHNQVKVYSRMCNKKKTPRSLIQVALQLTGHREGKLTRRGGVRESVQVQMCTDVRRVGVGGLKQNGSVRKHR